MFIVAQKEDCGNHVYGITDTRRKAKKLNTLFKTLGKHTHIEKCYTDDIIRIRNEKERSIILVRDYIGTKYFYIDTNVPGDIGEVTLDFDDAIALQAISVLING